MRSFLGFFLMGIIAIGSAASYLAAANPQSTPVVSTPISPEQLAQKQQAIAQDLVDTMSDKSKDFYFRLEAKRKLTAEYAYLLPKFEKELKAFAAVQRKEGVWIGMSAEEARASSWGRPERVNRSIYSFGVHEQWVYGGRNYLYFKDGVLTSIQN
jgi:hypothetical protein